MIQFDGIFKSFQQKLILENVSFSVKEGQITGLLGPNGAGKTSLIRILNRIMEADRGNITVNDEILTQKHLKKIGYLPEERGLYKTMSVWEQVKFFGQLREMDVADIQANYQKWEEKFEIQSWRNKRIEMLSKGMAQKVQFICSVIHQPEILILDEPFSGFDPINIDLIEKEIRKMRDDGKTILLSSHNMKSVEELCDCVVLINKGKKILEGNIHDIRSEKGHDIYAVRFSGPSIALATALWTGFELVNTEKVNADESVAYIKMRHENNFEDLLRTLLGQVKIEAAWKVLISMQDIFIEEVEKNE